MPSIPGNRDPLSVQGWPLVAGWVLVLITACWTRLWRFGEQLVIDDEWHALHTLIRFDYAEIFTRFGHADHSIPLTLWLKLLAGTIGLNEWTMAALFLAFGLATVVAVPVLLRDWLGPAERLILGALLAISPLLVYYARQARPYALTGLVMVAALVWLWRFFRTGHKGQGAGFVAAGALSAWMHPLTLAFSGPALAWLGLKGLHAGWKRADWRPLARVAAAGIVMTLLIAALLGPALIADHAALAVKAGVHRLEAESPWVAWQLMTGSGWWPVSVAAALLAVHGALVLAGRDRGFFVYVTVVAVGASVLVIAPGAAWIHHGLVLARYLLPLQLLALVLMVLGLAALGRRWLAGHPRPAVILSAAFAAGLYFAGPLPEIQRAPNAFTKHLYYQFDYRPDRNKVRVHLDAEVEVPAVYSRIAADPREGVVVEAGWHFESHYNPLVMYQPVHGRRVRIGMISGLCTDWTWGEVPRAGSGIELANFVHLADWPAWREGAAFLVFHRQSRLPEVRALPDLEPCIDFFRDRIGPPWHEDMTMAVFRVGD